MDAYLFGVLIGRLVAAYLLVWSVALLFSRFDWRDAFRRTHGRYGIVAIGTALGAALIASAS